MKIKTYNTEFWRWFLQNEYMEFQYIEDNQTLITGVENVFDKGFDLDINLDEGICIDPAGNHFSLAEYVALKNECTSFEAEVRLEVEYERWKAKREVEQANLDYYRDIDDYKWYRRKGGDSVVVTEFDLILESIIEKWNAEQKDWERSYVGKLRFVRLKKVVYKPFKFEPGQTHSVDEFSKSVWEKDVLQVKNMKNEDMRSFWAHVNEHYKPRIVREYDHYGFITFEKKKFFLAGNVLIQFPESSNETLQLIDMDDGAFPVGNNKFIAPPEEAVHLPYFDIGVSDSSGRYQKAMKMLLDDERFVVKFKEVEYHFCKMVGGDSDWSQWGKLILAYVFSYIFFEDIYGHFKHVIFLYLYGEGNVGKGEVAKRILDFYGINYLDSLNTPPARSVDEALEMKAQIPQWIDEHVPQVPGKQAKIEDQTWNSWFELKQRPTNIKKGNKWGKERKEVRTMPLFCSNFKPATDHLLSRSLIYEYKKSIRGPEKHVKWLMQNKELLQSLMLSYMQNYNLFDRKLFVWDLDRNRTVLRDSVKNELADNESNAVLQDRQVSQFAALLTVYHWINPDYREKIGGIKQAFEELEEGRDHGFDAVGKERIQKMVSEATDQRLLLYVRSEIIRTAMVAAQHDPLTNYIETCGVLVQANIITREHFNWTEDGALKIYAQGVWEKYEKEKRGTDGMVRQDIVKEKLKEISDLDKNGNPKTINWTIDHGHGKKNVIRNRGYYIKGAVKNELFRHAFNWEKYKPSGANFQETFSVMVDDDEVPF